MQWTAHSGRTTEKKKEERRREKRNQLERERSWSIMVSHSRAAEKEKGGEAERQGEQER